MTQPHSWLITGANGNLGKRLITTLLGEPANKVIAVVRSTAAQQVIQGLPLLEAQRDRLQIKVVDYTDVSAMREAAVGVSRVIHLVGILKETKSARYIEAHEVSTQALLEALDGGSVEHLTYLSILGSTPDSSNLCLASKGRAEELCLESTLPSCVLRVPMVLGEGDYASFALFARSGRALNFAFRASSKEQPIYAGDVVSAVIAGAQIKHAGALDLAGPEKLTQRELIHRSAQVMGNGTRVISIPVFVGMTLARVLTALLANPPITPAMLEVLDEDDDTDIAPAMQALGLDSLTGLDETLAAVFER